MTTDDAVDVEDRPGVILPLPTDVGAATGSRGRSRRGPGGRRAGEEPGSEPGGSASGASSAASDDGPVEGAEPAEQPVGLLAVWRASRARRRALRAEVRRFTVRQRRRRALWVSVIGAILVVAGVTAAVAYSPLFAVERVRVVGAVQLDAGGVEAALASQLGTPLPLVDEAAIQDTLSDFPFVQSYTLEARPPHELVVRIVERTPIGAIASASGYSVVDAAGVVLSASTEPPPGEPVLDVRGGVDGDAFAAVGRVMRALPASIGDQVTAVSATSAFDVTMTLTSSSRVVWGSAEESALKARVLETVMVARPADTVTEYDVSSPDAVVIR
ncbi:FtsQ-type POTRA domain-containing protein [Microbacterium sp. ET2]|uniref:FtsQ-type POTRA domain-containing protein n=1 Tax=Microbacterium albipurpureum TaxID=3050384 RepID=UPI00259C9280|nr:FtsQ-type POTRA domain-containing protein [Microbacterium sp. ET2 (Ac-2212)]WJL95390.1 FtsQ-type POTRA domain-containing protein [Microbacterium sp. ET2 (Ac-2212)]